MCRRRFRYTPAPEKQGHEERESQVDFRFRDSRRGSQTAWRTRGLSWDRDIHCFSVGSLFYSLRCLLPSAHCIFQQVDPQAATVATSFRTSFASSIAHVAMKLASPQDCSAEPLRFHRYPDVGKRKANFDCFQLESSCRGDGHLCVVSSVTPFAINQSSV